MRCWSLRTQDDSIDCRIPEEKERMEGFGGEGGCLSGCLGESRNLDI